MHRTRTARVLFSLSVVWLVFVSCASSAAVPPLPEDLEIVSPKAVPEARAVFSGRWEGVWTTTKTDEVEPGEGLPTILVVERVRTRDATVVYAWGKAKAFEPGFLRARATFKGATLVLSTRSGKISFSSRSDGKLDGVFELPGARNFAVLARA